MAAEEDGSPANIRAAIAMVIRGAEYRTAKSVQAGYAKVYSIEIWVNCI